MQVKDLIGLIHQLKEIVNGYTPETEVAFTDPNCWRSLINKNEIILSASLVEVKNHYHHYAILEVINGPRGYTDKCTKELLAKPTLKVLHLRGL